MAAASQKVKILTDPLTQLECGECEQTIDISESPAFSQIECPMCGFEQTVPAQLGQYRLTKLLGTGGMGGVFLATDEALNRSVAIKVMLAALGDDAEFVSTFKREAQSAAALNHPNVAQIYAFGQEKGQPYIVMELVSGREFKQMVTDNAPLDQAIVFSVGVDIAEGLKAAADLGLLHGDVKPENVLLDEKNTAKLVDFGLAAMADKQGAEGGGGIWGTPYYIAPEKLTGSKGDERADIYSLGATLFHALAGFPPFDGDSPMDVVKARLHQDPPDIMKINPRVSSKVASVIDRMLERDPSRRYPNYSSCIRDMKKTLKEVGPARFGVGGRVVVGKGKKRPATMAKKKSQERPKTMIVSGSSSSTSGRRDRRSDKGSPREKKEKKPAKSPMPIVLTVLAVLVLGGIIAGFSAWSTSNKKQRAAVEASLLRTAHSGLDTLLAAIQQTGKDASKMVASGRTVRSASEKMKRSFDELAPDAAKLGKLVEKMEALEKESKRLVKTAVTEHARGKNQSLSFSVKTNMDELKKVETALGKTKGKVRDQALLLKTQWTAIERKHGGLVAEKQSAADAGRKASADAARKKKDDAVRMAVEQKAHDSQEQEVARAKAQYDAMGKYLEKNAYEDGLADLQKLKEGFKTDAAKAELELLTGRFRELVGLKSSIRRLITTGAPIAGLWKDNEREAGVAGANEAGLILQGGGNVSWADIGASSMMRICLFFMKHAQGEEKASLMFKTGVYAYVSGHPAKGAELGEGAGKLNAKYVEMTRVMLPYAAPQTEPAPEAPPE